MAIPVNAFTLTSALGIGSGASLEALHNRRGGLTPAPWQGSGVATWLGRVNIPDTIDPGPEWDCRNNRLAMLGLAQDEFAGHVAGAIDRYGAHRVGVVIGTSTSSIERTEAGYRQLDLDGRFPPAFRQPATHNPHSPGAFVAHILGVQGPASTVSAACASSAKVFATASRWLGQSLVDAVVVGGVDSLCLSVIYGFHSLQLVSATACRPFDRQRDGISLGEAAGFALLSRDVGNGPHLALLGYGESCDAHHMSSAHPEGLGARLAMERALKASGLRFEDLDYVNLHGTGTRANDDIEGRVCAQLLHPHSVASATKGWTGHALGAAGIVEALLCLYALDTGLVPGTLNTRFPEADFNLVLDNTRCEPQVALSNSFGFGGNNCSLVFGRP
jgi:3-oxoacyl-[acyl-carrier-protein] synthase-1